LTSWTEIKDNQTRTAALTYDDHGNRSSQTVSSGGNTEATTYSWTFQHDRNNERASKVVDKAGNALATVKVKITKEGGRTRE